MKSLTGWFYDCLKTNKKYMNINTVCCWQVRYFVGSELKIIIIQKLIAEVVA